MTPDRIRRRGWSLLELLVVITAASAMLTITAGLVFQMLKVGQSERAAVVAVATLERLAHDLRADARAASGPVDLGPDRLMLPMTEGRSVEYILGPREALRTVRRGDKIEHHEPYRWPRGSAARFESTRDGSVPVIALVILPPTAASPAKSSAPTDRGFRIEAIPGRDARLGGGGLR